MSKASSIGDIVPKRLKIKATQRREQILALELAGFTQEQIATKLGVDRRTITRDLSEMKRSVESLNDHLAEMQDEIAKLMPPRKRVQEYVNALELAKATKQPSAAVQILARVDALDDI